MTAHMESLLMLILSSRFLGYLPCHYAEDWIKRGRMRDLLPDVMSYVDTFYLARLAHDRSRVVSTLYDCVKNLVDTERMPRY
jgi:DNA-binding transcriptional LysR family regulator